MVKFTGGIRGGRETGVIVLGIPELVSQMARLEKIPKKYLTKAAKAGADPSLKAVRAAAPRGKTGMLKKGLHKKMETPNKRNKTVYRIRWNAKYTDSYLKPTTGVYGGKTPYAYYPHSVEYGYKTKNGRIEGKYFAAKALRSKQNESAQNVVDSLRKSVDDLLRGKK